MKFHFQNLSDVSLIYNTVNVTGLEYGLELYYVTWWPSPKSLLRYGDMSHTGICKLCKLALLVSSIFSVHSS